MNLKDDIECCTDLMTWFWDFDISETLIRYLDKEEAKYNRDVEFSFGYIVQLIDLGSSKWLAGIQSCDPVTYEKHPYIRYIPLDNLDFDVYQPSVINQAVEDK